MSRSGVVTSGAHNPERATSVRLFYGVFTENGLCVNFECLLNSTNQSAKPTDLKMISIFLLFNNVQFSFFIYYTSNAPVDMVEVLFSREKVPLNVSKNTLVHKNAVT